jgi:hypothetical protein
MVILRLPEFDPFETVLLKERRQPPGIVSPLVGITGKSLSTIDGIEALVVTLEILPYSGIEIGQLKYQFTTGLEYPEPFPQVFAHHREADMFKSMIALDPGRAFGGKREFADIGRQVRCRTMVEVDVDETLQPVFAASEMKLQGSRCLTDEAPELQLGKNCFG